MSHPAKSVNTLPLCISNAEKHITQVMCFFWQGHKDLNRRLRVQVLVPLPEKAHHLRDVLFCVGNAERNGIDRFRRVGQAFLSAKYFADKIQIGAGIFPCLELHIVFYTDFCFCTVPKSQENHGEQIVICMWIMYNNPVKETEEGMDCHENCRDKMDRSGTGFRNGT